MKYYLGNFPQVIDGGFTYFAPPAGSLGCIDLAPLPVQAKMASDRPVGVFWTDSAILPSEYALIGDGDCRELAATSAMQDAFQSLAGYRPQGPTLASLVMDCLQGGSDPSGQNGPLPIVPTIEGWMDLWMPGHSRVLAERFEWGKPGSRGSNHTPKLQGLLRAEFAQLFADAHGGKFHDPQHHLRVLDFWCDKYNLQGADDWKEFVPTNLQKDVPGRVPHNTSVSDNFNRANGDLGASWTAISAGTITGSLAIASNAVEDSSGGGSGAASSYYSATALSSADHYSQVSVSALNNGGAGSRNWVTGSARAAASGSQYNYQATKDSSGVVRARLGKFLSGNFTSLNDASLAIALNDVVRCQASGSSISGWLNGVSQISVTDTGISGNLFVGVAAFAGSGSATDALLDNFAGSDVTATAILYTQLERGVRGLVRGTYGGSL